MSLVPDLHVMDAMQVAADSELKRFPVKSREGLVIARERLERACSQSCRWQTRV